jgi:protein-S-isoprenylcysteine O-methyltransferase
LLALQQNPAFGSKGIARTGVTGFVLGAIFMSGFWLGIYSTNLPQFAIYACFMSLFHFLEFLLTAVYHSDDLTWSSFLLDHSRDYGIAFLACLTEHCFECLAVPFLKNFTLLTWVGILLCIVGQVFRTGAMISAGSNFTHKIATTKLTSHQLVTTGLYQHVRHPSYFGQF